MVNRQVNSADSSTSGYCCDCKDYHSLPTGRTKKLCLRLMKRLERQQHLDLCSTRTATSLYSTDTLFGEARGKMFGVLDGIDPYGKRVILSAFSGQFNGLWRVPGWVPPLIDETSWYNTSSTTEKEIKKLSASLDRLGTDSVDYHEIKRLRKNLSQKLTNNIQQLYVIPNFRGQRRSLTPFFPTKRGIPTGTGDCCAPKLLHHAIQHNITPRGIAEFYWGRTNKSGSRKHGSFYPACKQKCKPILGFMLCGLDEQQRSLQQL